jgi:tetratricopeptide (TPR) repeat protein
MTKRTSRNLPRLLAFLVLFVSLPVAAQDWTGKGRLEGRVTDPDGKPIAGATVKLRLPDHPNDGPDIKTDTHGRWSYLGLRGGEWKLTIEAPDYLTGEILIQVSEVMRGNPIAYKMAPAPKATEKAEEAGLPPEIVDAVKAGNEALAEKKWPEAVAAFEKVLPAAPDNVSVELALARSYSGMGNTEKAIEMIRKVTDKEPSNWAAWMLMANMLLDKGKLEEARAALEHVPQESVTDPNIFINVGILFMNKGKTEEAEGYFAKAVEIAPGKFDGYYYRGLAEITLQKNSAAKADFQKVVELAPPDSSEAKEAHQLLEALKGHK